MKRIRNSLLPTIFERLGIFSLLNRNRRPSDPQGVLNVSCEASPIDEPFPPQRKRALTLPLPPNAEELPLAEKQTSIEQSGSILFTTLPLELRLRVYYIVLGGMVIHIVKKDITSPRIRHVICRAGHQQGNWILREKCWNRDKGVAESPPHHEIRTHDHLLALPMTCRQVYSEAIDVLYSSNTFNIANDETFSQLRSSLLQQRFNRIKCLEIPYAFFLGVPYSNRWGLEEQPWERMWQVIASMKGLQDLRVRVEIVMKSQDVSMTSDNEAQLLQPLMALDWLWNFEVDVSWLAKEDSEPGVGEAPFRVTRHTERLCNMDPLC